MDIDTMKAGRELDALISEKVMGKHLANIEEAKKDFAGWLNNVNLLEYSTDISAAWEVVEKITVGGKWSFYVGGPNSEGWSALFEPIPSYGPGVTFAPTAPLAICRAALKVSEKCPDASIPAANSGKD